LAFPRFNSDSAHYLSLEDVPKDWYAILEGLAKKFSNKGANQHHYAYSLTRGSDKDFMRLKVERSCSDQKL
jgi:hypothetical protein